MPLGDGASWDETTPTNGTVGTNIDDYIRHLAIGIRSRFAVEHEMPDSQAATSEAGYHKFLTLQRQTSNPTCSGTQVGALFIKTVATTGDALFCVVNSQEMNLTRKQYFWYFDSLLDTGTKASATLRLVSAGKVLSCGAFANTAPTGSELQFDINYNGVSLWTNTANQIILAAGSTATSGSSFVTTAVTAGGALTIDVDKIGSSVAGGDATVWIEVG